ncbi:NAD(P)-binding protein [Panus rudis PR-1116 ss-1]|nr:NAD(P)-binding protein [Panus rudis PR-1116 ss-1]
MVLQGSASRFVLVSPATRGLSLALTRYYLQNTNLPVYATHRSSSSSHMRDRILDGLKTSQGTPIDPSRLHLLPLELTSEDSIKSAAEELARILPSNRSAYIHTAFFTGGMLHPERQPSDLESPSILDTFKLNVISHMLLIKHFSRFLPPSSSHASAAETDHLSKWVHVSARVGSISDNKLGGWYSYRASKAALNQTIKTFDLHLKTKRIPAICVGVHPGTVKTDLSRSFWSGVKPEKLFEPEYAAERLADVVGSLAESGRGKLWDWAGKEIAP